MEQSEKGDDNPAAFSVEKLSFVENLLPLLYSDFPTVLM